MLKNKNAQRKASAKQSMRRACLQFRAIRSQCPGLLKSTVMPGTMPPVISQPERYRHCAKNGFNSNSCQRRDVAEPSSVHEQTRNVRISSSLWYIQMLGIHLMGELDLYISADWQQPTESMHPCILGLPCGYNLEIARHPRSKRCRPPALHHIKPA